MKPFDAIFHSKYQDLILSAKFNAIRQSSLKDQSFVFMFSSSSDTTKWSRACSLPLQSTSTYPPFQSVALTFSRQSPPSKTNFLMAKQRERGVCPAVNSSLSYWNECRFKPGASTDNIYKYLMDFLKLSKKKNRRLSSY